MPNKKPVTKKSVVKEKENDGVKKSGLPISPLNIIAMVIVLIIAVMVGWGFDMARTTKVANNNPKAVASVQSIAYDGQDGKNALDLLRANNKIETQDSSMGVFVTAINGISNTDNLYWMFYLNSDLSPTAPDKTNTKNSDKIEWRYEDISGFLAN